MTEFRIREMKIIFEITIQGPPDTSKVTYLEHCRDRIQDALENNEEDRLLGEAEVMAREAGEYLVENDNAEDDIEGEDYALQILLNMRGYGAV